MLFLPLLLATAPQETPLRLNDVSVVGTHNSYKQAMPAPVMAELRRRDPAAADALDYAHRPLAEQLDRGARQLEIDVNYDPQGGHYAIPGQPNAELDLPGFKVLHMPGTDNASHCLRLVECLSQIRAWSDAHPRHLPILLMFNAKESSNNAQGRSELRFDEAAYDALDAEIRSMLGPDKLITPDDVQGRYPTLREAVLANHWPTLDAARGRFLFALDEGPAKVAIYRGSRKSLEGRVFFINTDDRSPAAAYMTINDPIRDGDRIHAAVQRGFLVRTRADAETREARINDRRRLSAALASGAQFISTDYLWADPRFPNYIVHLPETARCTPARRKGPCRIAE